MLIKLTVSVCRRTSFARSLLPKSSLFRQARNMTSRTRTYEDAIDALNTLQSGFKAIEERAAKRVAGVKADTNAVPQMREWLKRIGYQPSDLDRLNAVHVAGTKGKGSTCAYVDSILSFYRASHKIPKNVGLFTSPHLVAVRERIRINSKPISEESFAQYFFEVWDALEAAAVALNEDPKIKPVYFRYLTLMSFHVFVKENIDAAVYEVGVGGVHDATNVFEHPAATAITTLGIDHTAVLGNTIEEITWHKAGIMKTGSPAFTINQVPKAVPVLEEQAREKKVDLQLVEINPALKEVKILPKADFQRKNASLAIKLASQVLKKLDNSFEMPSESLPQEFIDGLEQVLWRGRCETKVDGNISWYLDGAHNADSLKVATRWFDEQCSQSPGIRILIFNQQGRPEASTFLPPLYSALHTSGRVKFDHVIFTTNVTSSTGYKKDFVNNNYNPNEISDMTIQKRFAEVWSELDTHAKVQITPSIADTISYVQSLSAESNNTTEISVFVTGSFHLVGGALSVLEDASIL